MLCEERDHSRMNRDSKFTIALRYVSSFTLSVRNALMLLRYIFDKNFMLCDTTVAAFD